MKDLHELPPVLQREVLTVAATILAGGIAQGITISGRSGDNDMGRALDLAMALVREWGKRCKAPATTEAVEVAS